jgi:pyruvate dehydrogenase E1 component alpha subunit
MGTALARHQAQTDITRKAAGHGVPAAAVDGMDVLAVETMVREAAATVRRTGAPFLVEARTYRFRAHSMADPELYRSKAEVEEWRTHDPIAALAARLRERALLTDADFATIADAVEGEIAAAVACAEAGPWEPVEDLTKDVYTPCPA